MMKIKNNINMHNSTNFIRKKKKRKAVIMFDEEKRREFLSGFHKRKVERKQRAKEKLEAELKEEKKRLKQEARERYKKLLNKRPEINIDEFLKKNEFETPTHKVSILELDVSSFDESHIGQNKIDYEEESERENEQDATVTDSDNESVLSGFEAKPKAKKARKEQVPNAEPANNFATKKDLKKTLKVAALKQLQKSKAYQKKKLIERYANKKLAQKEKKRQSKKEEKKGKGKGKKKKSKKK